MTLLAAGLALLVGLALGLLGGGGSILTVPVLVYVLGLPVKTAVPMSLVVVGATASVGVVSHHRSRHVRWDAVLAFAPAAMAGAFLGGRLALVVSSGFQLGLFAMLMLLAAVPMYLGAGRLVGGRERGSEPEAEPPRRPRAAMVLIGLLVGALTGLVGIGGGFLYVPALVLLGHLAMTHAVGTSLALITVSCVAGLAGHVGRASIPWPLTLIFTALAMAGAITGSGVARRVPQQVLRRVFAVLLVIMGALVLLEPRP